MTVVATSAPAPPKDEAREHIVDRLILERAPRLAASPAWPALRPVLYALLDYAKARRLADEIAPMGGAAAMQRISQLLALRVEARGLERIPRQGRLIVVVNHPTGLADGVAVHDVLKPLRPDVAFYANSDAHRVARGFDEVLIPVEWVVAKRTRERTRMTMELTRAAMAAERALVIFPAGRLARRSGAGELRDPPWAASAVSLARRYGAPVAPIHLDGPDSRLFHLFHRVSGELRDITLFHELLNKRGRRFSLSVGPLIAPEALGGDAVALTEALKTYVERELPKDPDHPFA